MNYIDFYKWYIKNKEIIENSKIDNVFSTYSGIIFEIYNKKIGNKYLYIIPGNFVFISDKKEKLENSNFVLKLRKELKGKIIKEIKILNEDKILEISFDEKNLICEFVPNGVICLTDKNYIIIFSNLYKDFGYRKIKKGEKYIPPPKKGKLAKNFEEFREIILNSDKKDLVRCLAIDLSLGGEYSEYLLKNSNIDKNKNPKELNENELKILFENYENLIKSNYIIKNGNTIEDINKYFEEEFFKKFKEGKLKELLKKKEEYEKIKEEMKEKILEIDKTINLIEEIINKLIENYDLYENKKYEDLIKILKKENIEVIYNYPYIIIKIK